MGLKRPIHGGNLQWAATQVGCPASLIVDFSASINPLGPPESAIAAIKEGLKKISVYPDPDYSQLCSALAEYHQLTPEWILPGNGSAELLTWASWELSQLALTYLITPAFSDYWRGLQTFQAQVKPCPLQWDHQTQRIDLPSLEITSPKQRGLIINNPHNPTGKLFSQEMILPYLDTFSLVVVDEAFMDFLTPPEDSSLIPLVEHYPNLVILRSLTKFYSLPGLRLGYAISHPDRLKLWQKYRDPWPVNVLAAMAAEAVIKDRYFQELTHSWLIPTRNSLFTQLNSLPSLFPFQSFTNFLLVYTDFSSLEIQEKLLQSEHILIRDCLSFPELGDHYFRLAVRCQEDNQRLITALRAFVFS